MKKMLTKYWGVMLVIVLLSTLFVGGTVPGASAATLAWSVQPTPDTLGVTNQVPPATGVGTPSGVDAANLKVASDGTLFVTDNNTGNSRVWKSIDGGVSWTVSATILNAASTNASIADLAVSPSYATDHTVFVLANQAANTGPAQVYISTNGGITFAVLGGTLSLVATEIGMSLAISPTYSGGTGEVMAGTADTAANTFGNIYIWGRNGVQNWAATAAATPGDVMKVAYSPNFAIDMTRLAVSSNGSVGTSLNTMVAADPQWNFTLARTAVNASTADTGNATISITGATIAFPSDFNATSAFTRTCFVGLVSTNATDNIYRVNASVGVVNAMNPLTNIAGTDHEATSLAYAGTTAAGTLYFGAKNFAGIMKTTTPLAAAGAVDTSWAPSVVGPSGVNHTYVALANDYATSSMLYIGTEGANSAVSISGDAGVYFFQSGLIDTTITVISDFKVANATTFYMSTSSAVGGTLSLWKTADGGARWYRYATITSAAVGILRVSPNYATDSTVVFGLTAAAAPNNIYVTNNAGVSWTGKSCPVAVGSIVVKDMYTYYVGNQAVSNVQATVNGGWTWQPVATTVSATGAGIRNLAIDVASGALLACNTVGGVFRSTDSNVTWVALGVGVATAGPVAFDANYATNGFMYASNGVNQVFRFGTGYTAWLSLGSNSCSLDLLSTPDGTLYTTNGTAGMARSINPTAGFPTVNLAAFNLAVNTNIAATATLGRLDYAAGSNVIYSIDAANVAVLVYGDTLAPSTATAVPVATGPADGTIFPANNIAVFTWDAVAGALSYEVAYSTRSDWAAGVVTLAAVAAPVQTATSNALLPGLTYYWHVRVLTPVVGAWSSVLTFLTQLAPAAPNAPPFLNAASGTVSAGSTNPGGYDVGLNPSYGWGAIGGATGYEFQVATDPEFTALVVDMTGANALPAITAYTPTVTLANSKTYYWRVKGISATSQTAWSNVAAFTTMAVPQASAPPVIITQAPAPVINIPAAPQATQIVIPAQPAAKEISPTYIWAIIIIGAVLVLAVIVLIVRTRRSV